MATLAPTDQQVIVDLREMNKIVEVNETLAYAVIQPGVTQGQLAQYLREKNLAVWLDVTGAGHDSSVMGNTLDRGFGHSPYGDHCGNSCAMKIVLGDGRVLQTGLSHYKNAQATHTYPYGVGPSLDGLFAQSNYGIVTELTIWLMPRPEAFTAFFIMAPRDDDLQPLVDRLAKLRRMNVLQSTIHIANDWRVLVSRTRCPKENLENGTAVSEAVRLQLRKDFGLGAWNMAGALYGPRQVVRASKRVVAQQMRPYRVRFIDQRRLQWARTLQKMLPGTRIAKFLKEALANIEPTLGLMRGQPSNEPLRGVAWRVRGELPEMPADPRDMNAGLIWVSPVLPATGQAARQVMDIMEPIYRKHGFEPMVTFTLINPALRDLRLQHRLRQVDRQ